LQGAVVYTAGYAASISQKHKAGVLAAAQGSSILGAVYGTAV